MRSKFTPTAAVISGMEDTNTSTLVSVSKTRRAAIADLAGARQIEDPTVSLTCVHSNNKTSISSLENKPQHQ